MLLLLLIRIIMLVIIVYALFYLIKTIKGVLLGSRTPARQPGSVRIKADECPVCHNRVRMESEQFFCPSCGSNLVRNQDGKLRVKVN